MLKDSLKQVIIHEDSSSGLHQIAANLGCFEALQVFERDDDRKQQLTGNYLLLKKLVITVNYLLFPQVLTFCVSLQ